MTIWKNTCGESWQDTIENGWEVSGKPGAFLSFLPKGSLFSRRAHLLTTASAQTPYPSPRRKRQVSSIPLCLLFPQSQRLCGSPFAAVVLPAATVRSARRMRLLRQPPDNATAPASAVVIVCAIGQIPSLQPTLFLQPPAQTCHRQLCRRDGRASCPSIFSFAKEKQKKE